MTFEQYDKLKQKGLTDAQILSAAQQRGVEMPSEGFIGGILKSTILKPAVRFGQAVGAVGAKAFGVDDERLQQAIEKDQILNLPLGLGQVKIEGQKAFGAGGGRQIGADVLEAGATYAPYGRIAKGVSTLAKGVPVVRNVVGKGYVASGAMGGYATDVAGGLRSGEENPYALGAGTLIGAGIPFVPGVARQVGRLAKFGTTQTTGLAPETVTTLLTNPKALTVAQAENLDRGSLAQQVKQAFTRRRESLSGLGKEYDPIRQSGKVVKLTEDIPEAVLSKYGVKIENGAIKVGPESAPLSSTDRKAIEDFIAQYGGAKELTANGILNVRKALDNMVGWEQGKTGVVKTIEKEMRKMYDDIAKKQIPKLAELDAKYAPEAKMIRGWQKDFFNPDGSLKDAAINKIANIAGKGKDQQLARLERLIPGIGQKAQILKALEDIGAAEGHKVGTYFRGGNLLAGVGGFAAGGPVGAVISALVASPQISVPILKTVGRVRGWGDDAVTRLIAKLTTGKTLNGAELVMFRSAIGEHLERLSPGDQFLDSALKKKVIASADDVVPPVQTKIPVQAVTEAGEDVAPKVVQDVVPPQLPKQATPLSTATRPDAQKTSSLGTSITDDPAMIKLLTRERGAIGKPSNEFLLNSAKRELAKTPDDPKLKAFVSEMELMQEARKYKTAEEFVKGQGTPVYHATDSSSFEPSSFDISKASKGSEEVFFNPLGKGMYLSSNKTFVRRFGKNTMDFVIPKYAKTKKVTIDSWEKEFPMIARQSLRKLGIKYDDLTFDEKIEINRLVPNTPIESANSLEVVIGDIKERMGKKGSVQDAISDAVDARNEKYDVVIYKDTDYPLEADEIVVRNPSILKTRSQLTDIFNRAHAQQPSTLDRIKKAILPGDTPGKEGGYIINPFTKKKTVAIDVGSKEDLVSLQRYLKASLATGRTIKSYETMLERYADKYGIDMNTSVQKQIKRIEDLLEKTDTIDALPGTKR